MYLVRMSLLAVAIVLISDYALSQARPRLVVQVSTDNLWTTIIPDPDKFDWSAEGRIRTGYDFRGLKRLQESPVIEFSIGGNAVNHRSEPPNPGSTF